MGFFYIALYLGYNLNKNKGGAMAHQYYVYMTTNLINGKNYIGKHRGRLDDGYLGSGTSFKRAIQKHGEDNFKKAILEVCKDDEHAYIREAYWVEYFDAVKNSNFYNLCGGGDGVGSGENHPWYGKTRSDEFKRKISEANKSRTVSDETRRKISEANKGRKYSDETRRKLSEANKGENNPNYGKTPSAETRRKLSEAKKGEKHHFYGKTFSDEYRRKLSESHKGHVVSAETRSKLSKLNSGEKHPQFKHRPDITKERLESLILDNPRITRKEAFQRLNVGERVLNRIINELYDVPTFTELKKRMTL